MHPGLILFRTPKGEDIASKHGHDISATQRRALLAVDGRTSVSQLAAKVFWVENMEAVLQELYNLGLISDDIATIDSHASQAGGAGLAMKAGLISLAHELLGANAEKISNKINNSPASRLDLEETVLICKKAIRLTVSDKLADQFFERAQILLNKK